MTKETTSTTTPSAPTVVRRRVSGTPAELLSQMEEKRSATSGSSVLKGDQQGSTSHFPFKLYDMLEYASDSVEHGSAVSWTEDGKGFIIRDKDLFLNDIVPLFFRQTKFRSFVSFRFSICQLNSSLLQQ